MCELTVHTFITKEGKLMDLEALTECIKLNGFSQM